MAARPRDASISLVRRRLPPPGHLRPIDCGSLFGRLPPRRAGSRQTPAHGDGEGSRHDPAPSARRWPTSAARADIALGRSTLHDDLWTSWLASATGWSSAPPGVTDRPRPTVDETAPIGGSFHRCGVLAPHPSRRAGGRPIPRRRGAPFPRRDAPCASPPGDPRSWRSSPFCRC